MRAKRDKMVFSGKNQWRMWPKSACGMKKKEAYLRN